MNPASQWRHDIGVKLGTLYAANLKVVAVMLASSAARGNADQFSDLDLCVFWNEAPTDAERMGVIEAAGADLKSLYAYDPGESVWSDDYFIGRDASEKPGTGLPVEVAHYPAAFIDQTLDAVLKDYSTDEMAHGLISGIVEGLPLHGATLLDSWKVRAATYPYELSLAMVRKYAIIDHFWRWEMYLARGENLMMLYQSFGYVQGQVLRTLLGLNRVYYSGFKWLDVVAERLTLKPDHLVDRLREAYKVPPEQGVRIINDLVEDTFALVETHLPEIDIQWLRSVFHYRRPFWAEAPTHPSGG
jgi:hypothetical protein